MRAARGGFSLVETLVAMGLVLLLALFVLSVFPAAGRAARLSENRTAAAFLGQGLLDEARAGGYGALAASSGARTLSGTRDGKPTSVDFRYSVSLQALAAGKTQVWATVTWREPGGDRSVTVETIMVEGL